MKYIRNVMNSQDKKAAEEARQRELNELFAVAIKQPKVPAGKEQHFSLCLQVCKLYQLICFMKLKFHTTLL
jgi:hypothetical protein